MNADEAQQVVRRLIGYWPTPELTEEETVAWADELTSRALQVTPEEAATFLRRASHSGQTFRPRPGELVAGVQAERRALRRITDTSRMLEAGRTGAVSPERASQWVAVCRRALAGEDLAAAKVTEGVA
jgi:hypothetical protein